MREGSSFYICISSQQISKNEAQNLAIILVSMLVLVLLLLQCMSDIHNHNTMGCFSSCLF